MKIYVYLSVDLFDLQKVSHDSMRKFTFDLLYSVILLRSGSKLAYLQRQR